MELRQLRYFVTLSEELHFGRAAAREHIVQSALSQQVQRLERELGTLLLERTTRHVELTRAGCLFLVEARKALAQVDCAVQAVRQSNDTSALRIGIPDPGYDLMPEILRRLWRRFPDLEIHQIEVGVPAQLEMLTEGRLDVGLGRACHAPSDINSALIRHDPLGLLISDRHRFAGEEEIRTEQLADEPMLLPAPERAPEFIEFVREHCRAAGFPPTRFPGTVDSIRAGTEILRIADCVLCAPASCTPPPPGIVWRPLVDPVAHYPWSLLWSSTDTAAPIQTLVATGRDLAQRLHWLEASN